MRLTTTLLGSTALVLTSIAIAAEDASPDASSWHGWHQHGWHGYMPGFWWFFPLLMMLVFVFCFIFIRPARGGWGRPKRWRHERNEDALRESALDILNKRYARGDIDKDEYDEKRTTIAASDS